jgi:hypothetical protein
LLALERLTDRVGRTLRALGDRHGSSLTPISLPFTQGDLAARVGASRQRINYILGTPHRTGVIDLRGGAIHILAPSAFWQEDVSQERQVVCPASDSRGVPVVTVRLSQR